MPSQSSDSVIFDFVENKVFLGKSVESLNFHLSIT